MSAGSAAQAPKRLTCPQLRAMKGATKSAGEMIRSLSQAYNRARQSQITGEILEIIGGVEALKS